MTDIFTVKILKVVFFSLFLIDWHKNSFVSYNFFVSLFVGCFKNVFLSLDLIIIAFLSFLVINGASLAFINFFLIGTFLLRTSKTQALNFARSKTLMKLLFSSSNSCCLNLSLQNFLLLLYLMILASHFRKYDFRTVTTIFWKSETPVSIKADGINCFFLLVNIRSIQDGLVGFLKQVGPLFRFLKL